ncbi:uncharacterized protein LOC111452704 [Cucurbita moschata]|uniref:Uncharacterized protein LOC111452704 n=1 Tax=Cucurbita moschata TaxID=3662 RepID=A0A6J1GBP3_CUCMO|nr:uncharacterized protein LOC111452704 [Cucurbita moschata]
MSTNSGDFGGKFGKMRLKSLKTRDDILTVDEDYHTGVSATVPFIWESEPGTPKANFRDHGSLLSPLTPPPSYFSSPSHTPSKHKYNTNPHPSRANFLTSVFKKLSVNKAPLHPLSPGSSSSSTSSTTLTSSEGERGRSPRRLSFDSRVDENEHEDEEEEEENFDSPVSTLFFGRGGGSSDKGCYCYPKLVKVFSKHCSK